MTKPLSQKFDLHFDYTRSTGPVIGKFLAGLSEQKILGVRTQDAKVIVPPVEFDPKTHKLLKDWVRVSDYGEVISWCWVMQPRKKHPLQKPFAWALIKLAGSDTAMLHVVKAAKQAVMHSGLKVQAQWQAKPKGHISDIAYFEPIADQASYQDHVLKTKSSDTTTAGLVEEMLQPITASYNYTAGSASARFLRHLKEGRLVGQRSAVNEYAYMPPRGSCPKTGTPTDIDVPLADKGTVESFTIVHIPIPQNPIKPPFVVANILLDGAATAFIHLMDEVENADVHIGMRVEAVWRPKEEWTYSLNNIKYFRPNGEKSLDLDDMRNKKNGA